MGVRQPEDRHPPTAAPSMTEAFLPHVLREHSLLADGERGAVIGPRGDIAWMCAPRWDSDGVFPSLVGGAGTYAVTPVGRFVWGGSYEDASLVWCSRWTTETGVVGCREALAFPGEPGRAVELHLAAGQSHDRALELSEKALPERAEQGRNHHCRYVWIRDQCFTGQAIAAAGPHPLLDDAVSFVSQRLLADGPRLKPAHTIVGGPVPDQRSLGLEGYPGESDVVGNHVNVQFQLDAFGEALMLPPIRGALPAGDPRTLSTLAALEEELGRDGLMCRFRQQPGPLADAEGAFVLCGFTTALALHQQGREVEATRWFERNRTACGPPGLYSEEHDVDQRQLRGNLPQAFVHALMLEGAARLARPWQDLPGA